MRACPPSKWATLDPTLRDPPAAAPRPQEQVESPSSPVKAAQTEVSPRQEGGVSGAVAAIRFPLIGILFAALEMIHRVES